MPPDPLRVAVVGVGRIGAFHARHVQELAEETGACRLAAVVDRHEDTARLVAERMSRRRRGPVLSYETPEQLVAEAAADVAVVASRTADHGRDTKALVEGGLRVLLEKPLADSLDEARELAAWLDADAVRRRAVMLAFQRRYDAALRRTKSLLDGGIIGRPFKLVSALEDPIPPPDGYQSPGLLPDMAVHNIDEVLWLSGRRPTAVTGVASRLHNQKLPGAVPEDFDDAMIQLWLGDDAVAQIQVSRNHVSGYRNETLVYGENGMIHVGRFEADPLRVRLEVYGRDHAVLAAESFPLRDYGGPVPVFIRRFGDAYKQEVAAFVSACRQDAPFAVTQTDGLRAMDVAVTSAATVAARETATTLKLR